MIPGSSKTWLSSQVCPGKSSGPAPGTVFTPPLLSEVVKGSTRHLLAFRGPPRGPGSPCPWLPSQGSWAAPPLCPTAVPSYSRLGILLKCKPLPCSKPWNNSFLPVQPLVTSQTSFHTIPAPGRLHLMLPLPGYSLLHIFMATSFIHISAKCHLPAGLLGH